MVHITLDHLEIWRKKGCHFCYFCSLEFYDDLVRSLLDEQSELLSGVRIQLANIGASEWREPGLEVPHHHRNQLVDFALIHHICSHGVKKLNEGVTMLTSLSLFRSRSIRQLPKFTTSSCHGSTDIK